LNSGIIISDGQKPALAKVDLFHYINKARWAQVECI